MIAEQSEGVSSCVESDREGRKMEATVGESHHRLNNERKGKKPKSQELSMYQQRLSGRFKSENQKVHGHYLLFSQTKDRIL